MDYATVKASPYKEKWQTKGIGACVRYIRDDKDIVFVDYQPGNGTRYSVCFTFLGLAGSEQIGGNDVIVTIENLRKCMTINSGGNVYWTYAAEKLGLGRADAEPMTALMNHICERRQ